MAICFAFELNFFLLPLWLWISHSPSEHCFYHLPFKFAFNWSPRKTNTFRFLCKIFITAFITSILLQIGTYLKKMLWQVDFDWIYSTITYKYLQEIMQFRVVTWCSGALQAIWKRNCRTYFLKCCVDTQNKLCLVGITLQSLTGEKIWKGIEQKWEWRAKPLPFVYCWRSQRLMCMSINKTYTAYSTARQKVLDFSVWLEAETRKGAAVKV